MEKIKIYIVDDHRLFVEGVYALLEDQPGFLLQGYSISAKEFLEKAAQIEVDVYLVDINMPEITGIELTEKLLELKPDARILALTMYDDPKYIKKMIHSGASGYILKAAHLKELIEAIRRVAAGEKFLSKDIQQVIYNQLGEKKDEPVNPKKDLLSKREKEILRLIAKDQTNQEIAQQLFISELTVETHRRNILSKTGVRSIVGLIRYGVENGIIQYD